MLESDLYESNPTMYDGLAELVAKLDNSLGSDSIVEYITENKEQIHLIVPKRFLRGTDADKFSVFPYVLNSYCIGKIIGFESFYKGNIKIEFKSEYIDYVNELMLRTAKYIMFCMKADEYMKWAISHSGYGTLSMAIKEQLYTLDALRENAHTAVHRELYRMIHSNFDIDKSESDAIVHKTFLNVDKPVYAGAHKKNFDRIYIDVICRSDVTADEVRKNIKVAKRMIMWKLKGERKFRDNPELLKHLKISNMNLTRGILHFIIEWKESFVYEEE